MHGAKFCVGFRGGLTEEAVAAINVLQAQWPAAFPQSPDLIRPLANGVVATIAARTGWSRRYTASVLAAWRRQPAYSEALLRHDRRYDLTGAAAAEETVNDRSRARAREQIARLAGADPGRIADGETADRQAPRAVIAKDHPPRARLAMWLPAGTVTGGA